MPYVYLVVIVHLGARRHNYCRLVVNDTLRQTRFFEVKELRRTRRAREDAPYPLDLAPTCHHASGVSPVSSGPARI